MSATRQQLIAACEQLDPMADKVTRSQRLNAASRVEGMIAGQGPSWTGFVTWSLVDGKTVYDMTAEQFRAFLAAKRDFAIGACTADGSPLGI